MYERANEFIDRNRVELEILEAYGRVQFWRAFFKNPAVQFIIYAVVFGILKLVDFFTANGGIVATWFCVVLLIPLYACVIAIAWKIFKLFVVRPIC